MSSARRGFCAPSVLVGALCLASGVAERAPLARRARPASSRSPPTSCATRRPGPPSPRCRRPSTPRASRPPTPTCAGRARFAEGGAGGADPDGRGCGRRAIPSRWRRSATSAANAIPAFTRTVFTACWRSSRRCTAWRARPSRRSIAGDLTSRRLLDPTNNLTVGATLLEMWNAKHKELDEAFGGAAASGGRLALHLGRRGQVERPRGSRSSRRGAA